jgi:hypothetical protein
MRKLMAQQWVTVDNIEDQQDLELVEATSFENGVVLLRHEIKK